MLDSQNKNRYKYDLWGNNSNSNNEQNNKKKSKNNWIIDECNKLINKLNFKFENLNKFIYTKNGYGYKNTKNKYIFFIWLIIFTVVVIWAISGFYTIKESDRGVVFNFGKYSHIVEPGLNWRPLFIQKVIPVNIETVREQATKGMMLTSDENVIQVEMNVQYKVTEPAYYLFNVVDPDNSLHQAIDSAVRGIIGKSAMEQILTTKRAFIRNETQKELENMIEPYAMGISIIDVNFQAARPPEAVKAAFDDVIAAREEEQKTIREAQAYSNEVLPLAKGNAQKIIEEAIAYKTSVVYKAKGEIASFAKILPEYRSAPKITKERLYIETMERVLENTHKVIINNNNNNIMLLPLDKLLKNNLNNDLNSKVSQMIMEKSINNINNQIKPSYIKSNSFIKDIKSNHELNHTGR
uniref:Protein HflK n=1 Tax=Candidatus Aschnera chinzeii TaxID=1485666 RepID=A0AAT9G403_9ENTR|nr:MAG: hypothetical protein ACHINZ_1190 [Candidatus Aschnera chinzeii]